MPNLMTDLDVEFTDYSPGELPNALPVDVWACFDSCGEFLYSSSVPPCPVSGIVAHYQLMAVMER